MVGAPDILNRPRGRMSDPQRQRTDGASAAFPASTNGRTAYQQREQVTELHSAPPAPRGMATRGHARASGAPVQEPEVGPDQNRGRTDPGPSPHFPALTMRPKTFRSHMTSVTAFALPPSRRLFFDQRPLPILLHGARCEPKMARPALTNGLGYVGTISALVPSLAAPATHAQSAATAVRTAYRDRTRITVLGSCPLWGILPRGSPRGSALTGAPALTFR